MGKSSLLVSMVVAVSLVFTVSCVSKEVEVTETCYETEYKTEYRTETYTTTEDVVVETVEGSTIPSLKSKWRTFSVFLIGSGADCTYYYGYDISVHEYVQPSRAEAQTGITGPGPAPILVQELAGHTRSQVQVSFGIKPQMYNGIIYAVDLSDACYDQSIPFSGMLFGKEPAGFMPFAYGFIPAEGCQIIQPYGAWWVDSADAVLMNPERILGKLSLGRGATDNSITFDAKDIKEFAILINVAPEIRQPAVKLTWSDDIIEEKTVTKERQVPYEVPVQVEKQRTVMQTKQVPFWEAIFGE